MLDNAALLRLVNLKFNCEVQQYPALRINVYAHKSQRKHGHVR